MALIIRFHFTSCPIISDVLGCLEFINVLQMPDILCLLTVEAYGQQIQEQMLSLLLGSDSNYTDYNLTLLMKYFCRHARITEASEESFKIVVYF